LRCTSPKTLRVRPDEIKLGHTVAWEEDPGHAHRCGIAATEGPEEMTAAAEIYENTNT
jgi:hypothetical protein